VQQQEWDFWMTPESLGRAGSEHLVDCVEPLRNSDRLVMVGSEQVITRDLTCVPAHGHTPGHVAIGIASAGERGIIIGDASHHPVQLDHPDWSPVFDTDPDMGAKTREALMERAIDEQLTWMAGHWSDGIGRVVRLDGKRVFQAL
jgi:glyoxylase-like metal-dependent hydrolase (beta-lactamase superfamily II)